MSPAVADSPALRFPGFSGPWTEAHGGDAFSSRRARGEAGLPLYSVTLENGMVRRDSLEREIQSNATDEANLKARGGDIVYNMMRMWQGAMGVAPEDCMVSPAYVVLAPKPQTSSRFFAQWFRWPRALHALWAYSHGLTNDRLRLYYKDFAQIPMRLPDRPEQEKIADFLDAIDARLAMFGAEADELAAYKQGLAQRLFSEGMRFRRADGADYPEWVEVRLGDVTQFRKGKGVARDDVVEGGATPCLRYGELYTTYTENITVIASATNADPAGLVMSRADDVVLPASGEMSLDMASAACVRSAGVALGGDINILRTPLHGLFLAYLLRTTLRRDIARLAQGNSVVHLYGHHLATLRFRAPAEREEQEKIAGALAALDDRIADVRGQAETLSMFKAGLLQKLFV